MLYAAHYISPLGPLQVVSSEQSIIGLWMDGQKYFQATLSEAPHPGHGQPILMKAVTWLERYFAGERPSPSELPLAPMGSPFRQFIWQELCLIPYGEVVTYGYLAELAARAFHKKSMSAQAVGGAVGHNPISIIIPCHRVVGANGSLTGYAGGIDKKIKLLQLEGVDTKAFRIPSRGTAL